MKKICFSFLLWGAILISQEAYAGGGKNSDGDREKLLPLSAINKEKNQIKKRKLLSAINQKKTQPNTGNFLKLFQNSSYETPKDDEQNTQFWKQNRKQKDQHYLLKQSFEQHARDDANQSTFEGGKWRWNTEKFFRDPTQTNSIDQERAGESPLNSQLTLLKTAEIPHKTIEGFFSKHKHWGEHLVWEGTQQIKDLISLQQLILQAEELNKKSPGFFDLFKNKIFKTVGPYIKEIGYLLFLGVSCEKTLLDVWTAAKKILDESQTAENERAPYQATIEHALFNLFQDTMKRFLNDPSHYKTTKSKKEKYFLSLQNKLTDLNFEFCEGYLEVNQTNFSQLDHSSDLPNYLWRHLGSPEKFVEYLGNESVFKDWFQTQEKKNDIWKVLIQEKFIVSTQSTAIFS